MNNPLAQFVNLTFTEGFCRFLLIFSLVLLVFLKIEPVRRISTSVMPEVEALLQVDCATEPLRKVRVIEFALFLAVVVHQKLFQLDVVQSLIISKVLEDIFRSDISIIVGIKR